MNDKITIVMYHYVRDLRHSRYSEIKGLDIALFKEQIEYLNRNYNVIAMKDLVSAIDSGETLPKKACLLTFDDGYKDHFEYVFPVLDKYGLKGAFYPPAKAFLNHEVLFVNKIHFILASAGYSNIGRLISKLYDKMDYYREAYGLLENEYYYNKLAKPNEFDPGEIIFFKRLLQVELDKDLREKITDELFAEFVSQDEEAFANELYMNEDQLKCLLNHGMHIGSHGYEHCWLNSLDAKSQEHEIKKSIDFLKSLGVKDLYTMCYPYGGYNETTLKLLSKYNFKLGLTTIFDVTNIKENDKYQLTRLDTNHLPKTANAKAKGNEWYRKA